MLVKVRPMGADGVRAAVRAEYYRYSFCGS